MSESNLMFKNWKARCSSLGHIMTSLPVPITTAEKQELKDLLLELETGVNANGNKTKWTDTKAARVAVLQKKEKGVDELPTGAKTHLDDVFRSQFWGRKRILHNKFLTKGNMCEDDAIGLLSQHYNKFFRKNKEQLTSEYLQGMPDVVDDLFDTKVNWDFDTYDRAELTSLYDWQLKGYASMLKKSGGTLAYTLVNSPLEAIEKERKSLYFAMDCPDDENPEWIKTLKQLEKNHICDIPAFQKQYPHYQFVNDELDFTIPAVFRLKEFPVTLTKEDEINIAIRVTLARQYLCEKEIACYEKLKQTEKLSA